MKDYIERDPLVAWLQQMEIPENIIDIIKDKERFPAAEQEVLCGTWQRVSHQRGSETDGYWTELYLKCSNCGYERRDAWVPKHKPDFCEGCGADMRGD